MSAHLMIVAGYMDLPLSHKLTLMKLCDSADDRTKIAYPGLDAVRLWSGAKRSRGLEVLKELQEWGLVMQVSAGHRGHRAEFKVFPEPGDEVFSLAAKRKKPCPGAERFDGSPGIPDDQGIADRIAAMDARPGSAPASAAETRKGPGRRTLTKGSDLPDPAPERVQPEAGKGPIETPIGSNAPDPFGTYLRKNTFKTSPPADAGDGTPDELFLLDAEEDATTQPLTFADFWAAYPLKTGKKDAERRWAAVVKAGADPAAIVAGAHRFAADPNLPGGDEKRFIKHPATWLSKGCWEDEEPLPARGRTGPRVLDDSADPDEWGAAASSRPRSA